MSLSESTLGSGISLKPCRGTLDPARRFLAYPKATEHHAITVELGGGGVMQLVTERVVAYAGEPGAGEPESCWAAIEAFDKERQYSLLGFADEPEAVLLFHQGGADAADGELLWAPLECESKFPI